MNHNKSDCRALCRMLGRSLIRALLLGPLAAVAAGLFGTAVSLALCLTTGGPWLLVAAWALRGVFGGFVAGAVMGWISGIYHVEEAASELAATSPVRNRTFLPSRPATALHRSGLHARS